MYFDLIFIRNSSKKWVQNQPKCFNFSRFFITLSCIRISRNTSYGSSFSLKFFCCCTSKRTYFQKYPKFSQSQFKIITSLKSLCLKGLSECALKLFGYFPEVQSENELTRSSSWTFDFFLAKLGVFSTCISICLIISKCFGSF